MNESNPMTSLIVPYCERIVSDFELFNTLSNSLYLIASLACVMSLRHTISTFQAKQGAIKDHSFWQHPLSRWLTFLAVLPVFIGLCSAWFHSHPSHLTQKMDVAAIALFVALALLLIWRLHWHSTPKQSVMKLTLWLAITALAAQWPDFLAGSLLYLPTLLLLMLMAAYGESLSKALSQLAGCFALALLFRAADLPMCDLWPTGTHYIWHGLTAYSCWLAFKSVQQAYQSSASNTTKCHDAAVT